MALGSEKWMTAQDLADVLGKTKAWLYYHSRATDGPIQRRWGTASDTLGRSYRVVEFNADDAKAWTIACTADARRGVLYPSSLLPERLATPTQLNALLKAEAAPQLKYAVDQLFKELGLATARRLKAVAGGR